MAIEGLIFEPRRTESSHEDDRRILSTAFNGDLGDFAARQVKFATMRKDSFLGGHYHDYRELFYMLSGEAIFHLFDVRTKELEHYVLNEGGRILILFSSSGRCWSFKPTTR